MKRLGARVCLAAGLVLAVLASARIAAAAVAVAPGHPRWTPIGPPGGSVLSLAAASNGRTVYAGCAAGVYKSVNRGRGWQFSGGGLAAQAFAMRSPRSAPATVYALTLSGLFVTFDAALHWTRIDGTVQPFPGQRSRILGFDVSDSDPAVVYFAVTNETSIQVYGSSDAGASWHAGRGLPKSSGLDFSQLVVHPRSPNVAYLGLTAGAFKTTDGGQHWSAAGLQGLDVLLLTVDRVQPNHLYAYAQPAGRDSAPPGIYTSANGGGSWTARHDNLGGMALAALVADPLQAGTVYTFAASFELTRRILETVDGGTSWSAVGGASLDPGLFAQVLGLALDPVRPGVLYVALRRDDATFAPSVYRSMDGGDRWVPSAFGIQTQTITTLALDPQKTGVVYAGFGGTDVNSPDGLIETEDGGMSWTGTGFAGQEVTALVPDVDAAATLYAAAGDGGQVYRSVDAGGHWDPLGPVAALAIAVAGGTPWALFGDQVVRWDDAAATWVVVTGTSSGETFAAVQDGSATTLWFDNGDALDSTHAEQIHSGQEGGSFPVVLEVPGQSTAIVIDPRNPREVVVTYRLDLNVFAGGLFLSTDRGRSWKHPVVDPGGGAFYAAAIDPFDPLHVVASGLAGVFESHDAGDTWTAIDDGLPTGLASALQFTRQSPATLYAATAGGVYVLTGD